MESAARCGPRSGNSRNKSWGCGTRPRRPQMPRYKRPHEADDPSRTKSREEALCPRTHQRPSKAPFLLPPTTFRSLSALRCRRRERPLGRTRPPPLGALRAPPRRDEKRTHTFHSPPLRKTPSPRAPATLRCALPRPRVGWRRPGPSQARGSACVSESTRVDPTPLTARGLRAATKQARGAVGVSDVGGMVAVLAHSYNGGARVLRGRGAHYLSILICIGRPSSATPLKPAMAAWACAVAAAVAGDASERLNVKVTRAERRRKTVRGLGWVGVASATHLLGSLEEDGPPALAAAGIGVGNSLGPDNVADLQRVGRARGARGERRAVCRGWRHIACSRHRLPGSTQSSRPHTIARSSSPPRAPIRVRAFPESDASEQGGLRRSRRTPAGRPRGGPRRWWSTGGCGRQSAV